MARVNQSTRDGRIEAGLGPVKVPRGGWLKTIRVAREAAQSELAARLGCARQAWAQFEASEARGAISIASLRRAADVLGCDLVYYLVPRDALPEQTRSGERTDARSPNAGGDAARAGPLAATTPRLEAPVPDVEPVRWPDEELPTELR